MSPLLWPSVITLLTLVLLIWVMVIVAMYRGRYQVAAPATTGEPHFERAYRVQMNTIEGSLIFLPALWLAAQWGRSDVLIGAGFTWLGGRVLYALMYLKDPRKRGSGFGISVLATMVLILSAVGGMLRALVH